jgi:hypothetical protein
MWTLKVVTAVLMTWARETAVKGVVMIVAVMEVEEARQVGWRRLTGQGCSGEGWHGTQD